MAKKPKEPEIEQLPDRDPADQAEYFIQPAEAIGPPEADPEILREALAQTRKEFAIEERPADRRRRHPARKA